MNKLDGSLCDIHHMDVIVERNRWLNHIYPLIKLVVTICFITITVSFSKYNLAGILRMGVYPIIVFILGEVSFKDALRKLWVILPIICLMGIFNPIFDQQPMLEIAGITVTAGMVSMLTLMVKGIYSVLASYLLIATTPIEKICHALRLLHVPVVIVTQILLTYRYIRLLLNEARRMIQAYSLRAPNQKGVHFKVWGSLVGQLLLKSIDRADEVYESMLLRGYNGEFYYDTKISCRAGDYAYLAAWCTVFFCLRVII
ncbi:MAG: cobalt ECF transporter T component CbiQ [Lachnospiraceae bacterium]|jgi:cobalt/nickel transport system permease protein|nr:cobalt ECF transporter T component CbiQ [Lachnospiraceae bacterium]